MEGTIENKPIILTMRDNTSDPVKHGLCLLDLFDNSALSQRPTEYLGKKGHFDFI